jgi:hypothetical protein
LFVAKFDSNCQHVWSRSFGSMTAGLEGSPIAIDQDGAIVVAGSLFGRADFGGAEEAATTGQTNAYLLKLSADGSTLFSKVLECSELTIISSVALDPDGNIIVTGFGGADTNFDDGTLGTYGAHAAKFSPMGKHVWTRPMPSVLEGSRVGTTTRSDVVIASAFGGNLDWGDGTPPANTLGEQMVVSKLSSAGVHARSTQLLEGNYGLTAWGVPSAPTDRILMLFDGAATPTRRTLETLDADGAVLVTTSWDGAAGTWPQSIVADAAGNSAELGVFESSVSFGSQTFVPLAPGDVYVVRRDAHGGVIWADHEMSAARRENIALGLSQDADGNSIALWFWRDLDGAQSDELMLVKLAP